MKKITILLLCAAGMLSAQKKNPDHLNKNLKNTSQVNCLCCQKSSDFTKKVVVIVDGKEFSNFDLNSLNPAAIHSMNVLKDESAVKKYGERARKGAIEITTKKEVKIFDRKGDSPTTSI